MVVIKFLVFVCEVVSIFSKILTWIIGGGQKDTFAPPTQLLGGACPGCPPKSTPMILYIYIYLCMYVYIYIYIYIYIYRVVPKYESVRKLSSNLPLCDCSYREFLVKISARY